MPVFNHSMKYIIKNEELKKKVIIVKLVVGKTLAHENSVLIFNYFPKLYQTRLVCTPTKKKEKKKEGSCNFISYIEVHKLIYRL
jgi:hypothetical protein